ncbi:aromatic ring-hydroxylating dioxygenase subunit alpha [Rivularia sp. UHCC 0363]|uniref:aromatic ring-hydroxylating dioxygenase subunit alpha n=1 Tax=Rivularia sp. UHCC 0363 TaxID=3110244 RepID=UPI002B1FD110|nr:aromatic ring-hydroxylating dioxygenase subunit alpha [Rivularia sp. UHCC 0363]MEA5594338.1 aromatic ring-hydroxylating dioxygenase subunit alpha [Rivularia sp. UHCC 0363]
MKAVSSNISSYRYTQIFNRSRRFIEGWYWAIPSRKLRKGKVKAVSLLGRELVIYRDIEGELVCFDAYCPHMGAHLAEGKVEGGGLRCLFHNWKFDRKGDCVDVPCLGTPLPLQLKTWHVAEKYGMVWVWTGETPLQPLPFVPELENEECDSILTSQFIKNCHPNVLMINAIDAHHFNTVHNLPLEIVFRKEQLNENAVIFSNVTWGGEDSFLIKLIRPFYKKAITYSMCYWYGSIGTVTLGPDFLHFHIMFALRLIEDGKAEGQTILITKKRRGIFGWLFNKVVLWLTNQVGNYFAKGDTQIFQTIKFDLKTPTKADNSILQFIQNVEKQKALSWGSWEAVNEEAEKKQQQKAEMVKSKGEPND